MKKLGFLKVITIEEIIEETPSTIDMPVKTIRVNVPAIVKRAKPGQFAMLWLMEIDEKPMGFASCNKQTGDVYFTISKVGEVTKKLHEMQVGDYIGVRGPYGQGFSLKGEDIGIVSGGTGIAPGRFLLEVLLGNKNSPTITMFHGARTKDSLVYRDYFEELEKESRNFKYRPSTDDGSYGFEGFSTDCCQEAIQNEKERFDYFYTCGPEQMMYKVWKKAKDMGIKMEACLADRYIKCAVGLCGQCTVDPAGLRLCIDGPVFNGEQLARISDFGFYGRDQFGQKIEL
jgi:dihydroorotate dehydrogenase electron transfer subunit